ncbi:MAG: M28 family peptidase [Vicinamibacterales bacterium]
MIHHSTGNLATLLLAIAAAVAACVQPTTAADPPAFDGGRALEHLRAVVGFGPRPPGSAAAGETRRYIGAQMAAIGVEVAEQAFEAKTPIGPVKMVNVRATIPGARPERIILGGHYDTKLFRQFRFVGANDAGSSTAFLIEMARVLKARKNPFTIELLFIDGEEAFIDWYLGDDHTYGSRHYVQEARRTGDLARIKAMILVDMIGDRDLVIKRETASTPWLTDVIWSTARALGHGSIFVAEPFPVEDDHLRFLEAGVPAVNLIDLEYPPWHTAEDTLDKVSARSMEVVGRVLTAALPKIEARLQGPAAR